MVYVYGNNGVVSVWVWYSIDIDIERRCQRAAAVAVADDAAAGGGGGGRATTTALFAAPRHGHRLKMQMAAWFRFREFFGRRWNASSCMPGGCLDLPLRCRFDFEF